MGIHQYVTDYFKNYEVFKLDISDPNYVNVILILMFIIATILTIKKNEPSDNANKLLSISHTDQLRGLAIYFVVLGHLWMHVSENRAQVILSGDSVSLFLLLSGFGLAISTKNNLIRFKEFCDKRIKRVMFPYWLVTLFIVFIDYIFLEKLLPIDSLLMTIFGINTRIEIRHMDYVRWFVTFILFWYIIFYLIFLKARHSYSCILIFAIAFILMPIHYYLFKFGWYQFLSFPVGCFLGIYYDKIIQFCSNNKYSILAFSVFGVIYVVAYKILMSRELVYKAILDVVPNLFLLYMSEFNSLVFSFSCIILVGEFCGKGFRSNLLIVLGKHSYEIFLLHGVFLIRYNPIIIGHNSFEIVVQFFLFFTFIVLISIFTKKIHLLFNEIRVS